jgi:ABC-type branched-subunit amino acid transport system substrate-binding protein
MKRRILGLLSVLIVLASACSFREKPVVIGAVYPTGGSHGPGGLEEYRGAKLAARLLNEKGGVRGRQVIVRLAKADSSDAAAGAVDRLVKSGTRIIIGSYGSTISKPAAEAAAKAGAIFWETGAVGEQAMEPISGHRVFRFAPSGLTLGRAAVEFVRDQMVPRLERSNLKYGVAYVDDAYGRAVASGALDELRDSGEEVAASIPYDLQNADYDSIARQLKAAGVDVLMVSSYIDDAIALRRAVINAGLPLVVGIGTSSSYCMPKFGETLGPQAVGLFASDKPDGDVVTESALTKEARRVLRAGRSDFSKLYGEPMSAAALTGFAGTYALLKYVLPGAPSLKPADVAKTAERIDLRDGSLPNGGGLKFERTDGLSLDNVKASHVIWEWTAPGVRTIVWPPEFATEPVVLIPIS